MFRDLASSHSANSPQNEIRLKQRQQTSTPHPRLPTLSPTSPPSPTWKHARREASAPVPTPLLTPATQGDGRGTSGAFYSRQAGGQTLTSTACTQGKGVCPPCPAHTGFSQGLRWVRKSAPGFCSRQNQPRAGRCHVASSQLNQLHVLLQCERKAAKK